MRTHTLFKVAVLTGLLALSGCASKVTQPDKYSGFLKKLFGPAGNYLRHGKTGVALGRSTFQ
ncbi:DUF3313 domain-containing protein [Salmonella enterica]|uniref:DUF3313 domain-containing protein n=1 Tax=Salmonella enterica TaxID=28901 RepID=UPI0010BEEB7A|nr:DUF3313 domain-containing protein [Salmonella enterica]QCJ26392.1 DUF3313 domain-containing protein [Salmonella enterica subsp. enterica serovar Typhimurium]